ncbi:protein of unknown function [Pseudomonas inefficax]|uniref:Uncharacterized protein n=1 Tax=Pseudomonas inefficax TaxID=2078786 RepID=A0AAQ1ST18_9PSED|nr:protein of unknown function [Pseudomonas inefficax]
MLSLRCRGDLTGPFAGMPAPTGFSALLRLTLYLWERASPRRSQRGYGFEVIKKGPIKGPLGLRPPPG